MRQLKPRQKARVKAAKARGVYKAGIGLARKLAKGTTGVASRRAS